MQIRSFRYKGKMAARTAKLAIHMEAIMMPNRVDDSDLVAVLSFLRQFKRACDSNRVSKSVPMLLLPSFLAKSPAIFLTISFTPRIDVHAPALVRLENEA